MIEVGDIYFKYKFVGFTHINPLQRYYKVMSVTKTHVYLKNIRTGYSYNCSMAELNSDYRKIEEKTDAIMKGEIYYEKQTNQS